MTPAVVIDGVVVAAEDAAISVLDLALLRGMGVFEAMRAYEGVPFGLDRHLDRLVHSAAANHTPLADRDDIEGWCRTAARLGGECVVRLVCTPGSPSLGVAPRTVVVAEPIPPTPSVIRLQTTVAPWHPAGAEWALAGAKTLSYGPNLTAASRAKDAGFDDALLVSRDNVVLEGPTSAIGWVSNGTIIFPTFELGVLASVTRAVVEELAADQGISVVSGVYDLSALLDADEVFVLSTVKEVSPVVAVDRTTFAPGPITRTLAEGFTARVQAEVERYR